MKENKPGYKHTALGWIPEDWKVSKLREIATIDSESLSSNTPKDYEFDYISLSDVDAEEFLALRRRIRFDEAPSRARRVVRKGDILMSTVRPNLKGFTIIRDEVNNLIASTGFAVIRATQCHNEYVFNFMFCPMMDKQIFRLLVGSNYPAINSSDVGNLIVPLPPLPEQKAIAKVLSTWDKAIEKTQELIKQKELRKKYLMQQLLTGKKRLKGFSGEWRRHSYEELLKVVKRPVEWNDDELYQLISVRRRSGGIFKRESLYGRQILVKDLRTAVEGDFLFSKMQIVHGASALVTKEFTGTKVSGSYIAVVSKNPELLNIEFFNWYSKMTYFYHQTYISSYGVHIEKMTFDFDNFVTQYIRIPGIVEQKAITKILYKTDTELELLNKHLEVLQLQKKGLMQVLLTGKKRIVL